MGLKTIYYCELTVIRPPTARKEREQRKGVDLDICAGIIVLEKVLVIDSDVVIMNVE